MTFDINSPEAKEAIKQAVDEAKQAIDKKNKELIAELREARKNAEIKPEQLEEVEAERDKLREQLDAVTKDSKKHLQEFDRVKKQFESEAAFTSKLLVDNGLMESLARAGVTNPVHQKAAAAMLRNQVQLITDGEQRTAKVGDKPLADFIGEWAKGDEGKFFVAAPQNSGGSATGGSATSGSKVITRNEFDGMAQSARAEFLKSGGKLSD